MPEIAQKPVYLADPYSDPVVVRIEGRASFQNSPCLNDFIAEMLRQGKTRFVFDFSHCLSMDSTFLGVLAGAALELKKAAPQGSLVLTRVGPRNLELIRNLGLHRLLTVEAADPAVDAAKCDKALECPPRSELESARHVLESHQNLISADETNRARFQDVLTFLRDRVAQR